MDGIYNAFVAQGITPSAKTTNALVAAVTTLKNNASSLVSWNGQNGEGGQIFAQPISGCAGRKLIIVATSDNRTGTPQAHLSVTGANLLNIATCNGNIASYFMTQMLYYQITGECYINYSANGGGGGISWIVS